MYLRMNRARRSKDQTQRASLLALPQPRTLCEQHEVCVGCDLACDLAVDVRL